MENELKVLQDRYGWIRDEILIRLEYRYKLSELLLAFVPVALGFIWYIQLYEFSFFCCLIVIFIGTLFYGENRSIVELSNYLVSLETQIEKILTTPVLGWETYARGAPMRKVRATPILLVGFALLIFVSYTIFNIFFSFLSKFQIQAHFLLPFSLNASTVLYLRVVTFAIIEIPIGLWAWLSYSRYKLAYWRKPSLSAR